MKKIIIFLMFSSLFCFPLYAAEIEIDNLSGNKCFSSDSDGVVSWAHNVGAEANFLVVGISTWDSTATNGEVINVTYNNTSLTKASQIQNTGTGSWSSVWYLENPDKGNYNVEIRCSGSVYRIGSGSISLKNVGGIDGAEAKEVDANNTSCSIECSQGAWIIDATGNPTSQIASHGTDQIEYFTCSYGCYEGTYKSNLDSGTNTVSHSIPGTVSWTQVCLAIKPEIESTETFTITISWLPNTETDLAGYKLYYGANSRDNEGYSKLPEYQIALIPAGTEIYEFETTRLSGHFFSLTAYDFTGNESEFSNEAWTVLPEFPEPKEVEPLVTDIQ